MLFNSTSNINCKCHGVDTLNWCCLSSLYFRDRKISVLIKSITNIIIILNSSTIIFYSRSCSRRRSNCFDKILSTSLKRCCSCDDFLFFNSTFGNLPLPPTPVRVLFNSIKSLGGSPILTLSAKTP